MARGGRRASGQRSGYKRSYHAPSKRFTGRKNNYMYVLKLQGGRRYVGTTSNPSQRLGQHFSGQGAQFTRKNRPVSVQKVQRCTSAHTAKRAEQIVTGRMAGVYGKAAVRGGGWTKTTFKK